MDDKNFEPVLEFYRAITEAFVVPNKDGSASIYYAMSVTPDKLWLKDFKHYRTYASEREANEVIINFDILKEKARTKWPDVSKKLTSLATTI